MQHFTSLARTWAADHLPRHLLYACGAAFNAAGFYFRPDDAERGTEDGVRVTPTDSSVPEVSLDEAHKKYKQVMEANVQLQQEINKLVLNENYDRMKESMQNHNNCILRDLLQEKYKHHVLQIQYQELEEYVTDHENRLKKVQDAQAEAERKKGLVMESNSQLLKDNFDLIPDMNTLHDHVHELEQKLSKIQCSHAKLTKDRQRVEEDYSILQSQYEETLKQRDELLKEEKYEVLMSQVNTLQDSVQHLEKELREKRSKCEEITKEREQDKDGHSFLKCQYEEMKETFKLCDELLKKTF